MDEAVDDLEEFFVPDRARPSHDCHHQADVRMLCSDLEVELEEDDDDDDDYHYNKFNVTEQVSAFMSSEERVEAVDPETLDEVEFCSQASTQDELRSEISMKMNKGCGCIGFNHYRYLDASMVYDHILWMRELTKAEHDLYIMGKLTVKSASSATVEVKRKRYCYNFNGQEVCRNCFLYLHNLGEKCLKNIMKHISTEGITPRSHGNTGKKPKHAMSFADASRIVNFLVEYASENGLPQPAAPRGRDNYPPIILPANLTKEEMFKLYVDACTEAGYLHVQRTSFKDTWKSVCPHIQVSKPRSDVCHECEIGRKEVAIARGEEEILALTESLTLHINRAKEGRAYYNQCIKEAELERELTSDSEPLFPPEPNTIPLKSVHYTFDYAQNVCIPHHSRQMGPLYFLTTRKVQIFGVAIEGEKKQVNFLIDEHETIGPDGTLCHGPDSVISMLHAVFTQNSSGEQAARLHADNCSGQNKNWAVLAYLSLRTILGLHTELEYCQMERGHTRCLVDGGFGRIKQLYRRSDCDSLEDVAAVVDRSLSSSTPKLYDGGQGWQWYAWKAFLSQYYRKLSGIRKFSYFRFHHEQPGIVHVRERHGDAETAVRLLKRGIDPPNAMTPDVLKPAGLSLDRQNYLYKHIRPFVRAACQDMTCPEPERLRPR